MTAGMRSASTLPGAYTLTTGIRGSGQVCFTPTRIFAPGPRRVAAYRMCGTDAYSPVPKSIRRAGNGSLGTVLAKHSQAPSQDEQRSFHFSGHGECIDVPERTVLIYSSMLVNLVFLKVVVIRFEARYYGDPAVVKIFRPSSKTPLQAPILG